MPFVPDPPHTGFTPDAPGFQPDAPPRDEGVPNLAAAKAAAAAYQPPSVGEKIRGGVEAALSTVRDIAASVPTMAGGIAGFVGALGHNFNVATMPAAPGREMADPVQTAQQWAQAVNNAIPRVPLSPTGEDYAHNVQGALEPVMATVGAHFPGGVPGMHDAIPVVADATAPARRAVGDAVMTADSAVGDAGRSVAQAPTRMLAPKPDKELIKTATMATDKFPDIAIHPDNLALPGTSTGASLAQSLRRLPGAGNDEATNLQAISNYGIKVVDPANEGGRLTPEALGEGLDKAYALIKTGYDEVGPLDGHKIGKLLDPVRQDAAQYGSDPKIQTAVDRYADALLKDAGPDHTIPADKVQEWDQRLGQVARTTADPELARYVSDLQDVVRGHIETQVSPATAANMRIGRQRYAMGVELQPIARQSGTVNSGVINDPGDILRAVTDDKNGKIRVARGAVDSPLIDLAKAADLAKPPAASGAPSLHIPFVTPIENALKGAAGAALGRTLNKRGPEVTRAMVEKNRPAPEPVPEAPPEPLALGYDPAVSPSGGRVDLNPVAVTPEGQAIPHGQEQAREDLAVSQRNAGGTHNPVPPEAAIAAPAWETGQGAGYPQGAAPAPAPAGPLGDLTPDWATSAGAGAPPPAPAQVHPGVFELPKPALSPLEGAENAIPVRHETPPSRAGREIPAVPGRPDLPDTMVSGRPGETAADAATGKAMQSDDASLARHQQTVQGPAKAPEGYKPPPKPQAKPAKPKPKGSDHMVESKPAAEEKPALEFDLSDPQWRHEHGGDLGSLDTETVQIIAQAHAIDPEAVAAAAARYTHDPRGFEKAAKDIIAKGTPHASEH